MPRRLRRWPADVVLHRTARQILRTRESAGGCTHHLPVRSESEFRRADQVGWLKRSVGTDEVVTFASASSPDVGSRRLMLLAQLNCRFFTEQARVRRFFATIQRWKNMLA